MSVVHNVHYDATSDRTTVRLYQENGKYITRTVEIDALPVQVEDNPEVILKSEYDVRDEFTGPVFNSSKVLKSLRSAAVHGATLGLLQGPGRTPIPTFDDIMCTMGYDIECENGVRLKSLPLPQDGITCASVWCPCGFERSYQTLRADVSDRSQYCLTTSELCRALHADVKQHNPVWFVGYNSYRFDNLFLSYWDIDQSYMKVFDKASNKSTLMVLYEEGINNVDVYPIVDASFRTRFSSLRLGTVASELGLGGKLSMPSQTDTKSKVLEMIEYNLLDSKLAVQVFLKLELGKYLMSLCTVMKSCFLDVVRGATGVMCSCMLSSYALSKDKILDWSKTEFIPDDFEGGLVLEPNVGFHRNVAVVDFKSMYPYIMLCACISHDNVTEFVDESNPTYGVRWASNSVLVRTPESTVRFKRNLDCLSSVVLEQLIEYRSIYGSGNPAASASIKAATNSLYGSLGYEKSPLYSPRASRCVTAIARWLLTQARDTFANYGLNVVYGDTDSLFVTSSDANGVVTTLMVENALVQFHGSLSNTPFNRMSLRLEPPDGEDSSLFSAMIMLAKKMYILISPTNKMKARGVAVRRKDRMPIVHATMSSVILTVAELGPTLLCERTIRAHIRRIAKRIRNFGCTLEEVSIKKRVCGNSCLVYKNYLGDWVNVEESPTLSQTATPFLVIQLPAKSFSLQPVCLIHWFGK